MLIIGYSSGISANIVPNPIEDIKKLPRLNLMIKSGSVYNKAKKVEKRKFSILDNKLSESKKYNLNSSLSEALLNSVLPPTAFTNFMVDLGSNNNSAKLKKVERVVDKALSTAKRIKQLASGDLVSLPLVLEQDLGETTISIIFNSAKIYSKFAEIEVFIKIEMPHTDFNGEQAVLYFGADDIRFSSENGLISGSVGLLSDYSMKLGSNDETGLYFKKMEKELISEGSPFTPLDDEYEYSGTYVNFDCDGFKEMGIGGGIFFSEEILIATDEFGNARAPDITKDLSTTPRVHAHYQIIAQDFNDIFINLNIDHFKLKKWDKMSFYLGNANLDLSSFRNPTGIPYPHVSAMGPAWEGVYIEAVSITLPKPFKRNSSSFASGGSGGQAPPTERIKVSAEHLLIDEFGVYGNFSVVGQAPLIGGPIMDGEWGWSLDSITIGLEASNIDSFSFGGGLGVPILSKEGPLGYFGSYSKALDTYSFSVEQETQKKFPIWNAAQVNITSVGVTLNIVSDEFRPEISFNGSLTIGNPNDYASSQQGSSVKMPGIEFVGLKLKTVASYVSVQSITLTGGGSKVANFPVTVTSPTLSTLSSGDLSLGFDLGINLMNEGSGVSATGDIAIVGEFNRDLNGAKRLKFKRIEFNGATVTISLPQFYATGQLCMFEEDPVYGKGFSAKVLAKVIGEDLATKDGKFNIFMGAIFGSTNGYRYWLVDGFVKSEDFSVPIVPGVIELNGFGGGAFHHMKQAGYDPAAAGGNSTSCSGGFSDYAGIIYNPYLQTKLGIKFSTSFTGSGGLLSGLLTCILRFGEGYSLQNITFWGTAELLIKSEKAEKILKNVTDKLPDIIKSTEEQQAGNKMKMDADAAAGGIHANVGISLDFEGGFTFHTFAEVKINLLNALEGRGTLDILVDDENDLWHFWLGAYYDPKMEAQGFFDDTPIELAPVSVSVNYGGFSVSANAYFLTGNDIPGPPGLAPEVAAFFDIPTSSNNRGKLTCDGNSPAMGSGIAFGASAFFDFNKFKKGFFGSCFPGYKLDLGGGLGFDLSLLKYAATDQCQAGGPIGGINGLRATGRVWAFINIESGHVICIPIPHFGVGLYLGFDVIKPSYLQGVVVLDFIKKLRLAAAFGEECGTPCTGPPID